ncbi:MAG: CaiB/BaiF CoA transferase family protein [Dehalococcoidia bacterium]
MKGCLTGIRVLELARYQAGPRAGMLMSDMGAEVIKVEKVGGEETRQHGPLVNGTSVYFTAYNRGKKSITLNMRSAKGKELFRELVKCSDVVLENFRPGVIARMGFGYDVLKRIKRDIILTSVSGFGQYGPYRDRPAFDPLGQAMSGLMDVTGLAEGHPILTGSPIVDRVTSLHACIGTLGALLHRNRTGEGQVVDVSLLDTGITLTEIPISHYLGTGAEPEDYYRSVYKARDGYVVISVASRELWSRMFKAMGRSDLAEDSRYLGLSVSEDAGKERLAMVREWVASRPVTEVTETLVRADVPVGPVQTVAQMARDPHLSEREMLVEVANEDETGTIMAPGLSIKFSETKGNVGKVPAPGEHNQEILGGILGLGARELEALKQEGAI